MEQRPENEIKVFRVLFHADCKKDFAKIPQHIGKDVFDVINRKLTRGPQYAGMPLKGTKNLLYKLRISKYRVVYCIVHSSLEVWILAIEPRKEVYRDDNIASLIRIGMALHGLSH